MKRKGILSLTIAWVVLGMVFIPRGYGGLPPGQATLKSMAVSRPVSEQGQAATASSVTPSAPYFQPVAETAKVEVSTTTSGRPLVVSKVSIERGTTGESAFVDIATTRPAVYRVTHLTRPARLVVDLDGARLAGGPKNYPADSPLFKGVRAGQFRSEGPAVVRVVVDLTGSPAFDVHAQSNGVRIELKEKELVRQAVVPAADNPVAPEAVAQNQKPVEVTESTSAVPGRASESEVVRLPATAPSAPIAEASVPLALVPTPTTATSTGAGYQAFLPATVEGKQATAAPRLEPPTQTAQNLQAERAARILATEAPALSLAPAGQTATGATAGEGPKYTGEPISLNLKDVDLKDFFRLIHEISGLNMIIDPNVTGTVTLVLDSVPWDQALDIVLKNNRLDKTLEGNVLRIAKVETLSAEQEAITKLVSAREDAQPLVTVFRPVNYAKAGTISTMIRSWVGGGALTKRGNILVDDRTNTLIVSDIQSQIPVVEAIITKLDRKAKQVSIEARIVLATTAFSRSLQALLTGGTTNRSGTTVVAGVEGDPASSVTPKNSLSTPGPNVTLSTASSSGFGAIAISNAGARYIISAAIAAAETKSEAKTISRPSIVTQNNVPGTVQQGTQIPIQTSINNTITIQYVAATLQLTVTPQVTEDGNIFMIINVNNSSPGAVLTSAGPSINTQSATTQVLVPDGGTVVFGGVTVTSRTKSATYVPLLGNIPILGHLFKTSNVQDSDNELLFFVSPKVLPG